MMVAMIVFVLMPYYSHPHFALHHCCSTKGKKYWDCLNLSIICRCNFFLFYIYRSIFLFTTPNYIEVSYDQYINTQWTSHQSLKEFSCLFPIHQRVSVLFIRHDRNRKLSYSTVTCIYDFNSLDCFWSNLKSISLQTNTSSFIWIVL